MNGRVPLAPEHRTNLIGTMTTKAETAQELKELILKCIEASPLLCMPLSDLSRRFNRAASSLPVPEGTHRHSVRSLCSSLELDGFVVSKYFLSVNKTYVFSAEYVKELQQDNPDGDFWSGLEKAFRAEKEEAIVRRKGIVIKP